MLDLICDVIGSVLDAAMRKW